MWFSVLSLVFLVASLVVNLLELVAYVLIRPVSLSLFRRVNAKLCYLSWCIIPWALENWSRLELRIFAKEEDVVNAGQSNMIAILNHRGDIDWMLGYCVCDRLGILQNVKCLMKSFVKYLPTVGWSFWFSDYTFLKRSFDQDHKRLTDSAQLWTSYDFPWTVCLFAEGTRFTEEKHQKSLEYARKKGLPELKHHLLPRTKGFNFILHEVKDHVPAVYDITFGYPHGSLTLLDLVKGKKMYADVNIKKIPVSDIPTTSEEETSAWLINLFKQKDDLVEYHSVHGRFPTTRLDLPSRPYPTAIMTMWFLLLLSPFLYYVYDLVVAVEYWKLITLGIILLAAHFGMRLLMTVTEVQGSQQPAKKDS